MAKKEPTVVRSPQMVRDVIEIADYLAQRTSLAAADRFVNAAERTIERLARMPGIGNRWDDGDPELANVRVSPISRYRNHLVFYRPIEGGIEVLRVLHGARDITRILRGNGDAD
jgi:toxin ParE1/3/4